VTTTDATAGTARWWQRHHGHERGLCVAYFSMEFGVDEALPVYSGGLGILAGDHLKAAGELGIPLIGVGLLYRGGYFRQGLDAEGRQTAEYQPVDHERAGLVREPIDVELELGEEAVRAALWRKDVGPVPLYLLEVEWLTDALYGGDREHRIRQELLLGVGGVRALAALGVEPTVFHMNEGHSAFLAVERTRALVEEEGWERNAAIEHVRATTVFTTHTPVPAGNEVFAPALVERYVGALARRAGLSDAELLALGRFDSDAEFGLTPFALRLSARANGVSALHASVARGTWAPVWPGRSEEDVPIGHVTNGVHAATWVDPALARLLRRVGIRLDVAPDEQPWERVHELDGGELWAAHEACRSRVAEMAGLDPGRLTIGFARRFATYKRAGLVFSQLDRLLALPVQVVVAGKAHPADEPGKDVMQAIVRLARNPAHEGRIVFLENYDMGLALRLIPGCDVWLNTPRRPLEASGTSGMKAALNGVLNLSVLDGWWAEAFTPEIGWAIDGASDEEDAEQLYRLLAGVVVPAFFGERERWVEMMRASIARTGARFSMHRAVIQYAEAYYVPAHFAPAPAR
jgi:starch phosphorylase